MKITFWGTRGSVPVPDRRVMRYGGNTTCAAVEFADELLIIDAGTGIRRLGELLAQRQARQINLLVTHTHWDHIHGFPFFAPIHQSGVNITIHGYGTCLPPLRNMFNRQMALEYFPVTFAQLRATVTFAEVSPAGIALGGARLRVHPVNHPAPTVGVRVEHRGAALVFITDNELFAENARVPYAAIVEFCRGAQVLVHDAQFTDAEYAAHRGWGHSTFEQASRLAADAGVPHLVCFHHDPDRLDAALGELELRYQKNSAVRLTMAREDETLTVAP